jgi:hypothetical protein
MKIHSLHITIYSLHTKIHIVLTKDTTKHTTRSRRHVIAGATALTLTLAGSSHV